jgi:Lon protease-like protein
MRGVMLPLFPLELVLFPRTPVPLHIFEERYKEMIGEAIADSSEFGIVMARDKGIVNIGCTAVVQKVVERYPDGRLDLIAAGRRRFEVHEIDQEKAYLRGEVSFFDDVDFEETPADLKSQAIAGYKAARDFLEPESATEIDLNDPQLSFQLATILSDLDLRQQLLAMRSEARRIRTLAEQFPVFIARQRRIAHAREVAPRNGHVQGRILES